MRYRELFCVFPRTMKSGRRIYYYHTYDDEGKRTPARSTGAICARDARLYACDSFGEHRSVVGRVKDTGDASEVVR